MSKQQICLVPKLQGVGGTSSFQAKFIDGLITRNIPHTFDLTHPNNTAILVIGGTRQIFKLWRAKRQGRRIVQRLNGMNWMHKVEKTPWRAFLRAELNNRILAFIRRFLSDRIVYQSEFSQTWWNRVYGERQILTQVTYNGVDLEQYSTTGPETPPNDHFRILVVEGHLSGANAKGLETAVKLAQSVKHEYSLTIELMVVGDVNDAVKAQIHTLAPDLWITWRGVVPREMIPAIDRAAHVLFSTDINAACPNSVIEALACGLPVLAYDTGALSELVRDDAGKIVPYGADYWQLEDPHISPLAAACVEILNENTHYRQRARQRAQAAFGLDLMVDKYIQALVG